MPRSGEFSYRLAMTGLVLGLGSALSAGGLLLFEAGIHNERAAHATTEAIRAQELDARDRSMVFGALFGVAAVGAATITLAAASKGSRL